MNHIQTSTLATWRIALPLCFESQIMPRSLRIEAGVCGPQTVLSMCNSGLWCGTYPQITWRQTDTYATAHTHAHLARLCFTRFSLSPCVPHWFCCSLSISSPQKSFMCMIQNNIYWIKVSRRDFVLFWKQNHLCKLTPTLPHAQKSSFTRKCSQPNKIVTMNCNPLPALTHSQHQLNPDQGRKKQGLCDAPYRPVLTNQYGGAEWQWCECYLLSE